MKQSSYTRATRQFLKTTTLHGFKYLTSRYYYDRIGWLVCCCASACCAGVLCAVLWARFLQVPALLTLYDTRSQYALVGMPLVAVCPPAETVAEYFQEDLTMNITTGRLQTILGHILRRKLAPQEQLAILEETLFNNNLSLPEALLRVMPPCDSVVRNCLWQSSVVACKELFIKKLTEWGPCCVSRPYSDANNVLRCRKRDIRIFDDKFDEEHIALCLGRLDGLRDVRIQISLFKFLQEKEALSGLEVKRTLDIAVQCSEKHALNGCEFFTKYDGEEWKEPITLTPGYNYLAQMVFTSVVDSDPDKLVDGTCVSTEGYSRSLCLLKCKERACRCSDPLRPKNAREPNADPPCLVTQLNCLRSFNFANSTCKCLPSCKKISTYMSLESSYMNAFNETTDKIYAGLNVATSSVLHMAVRISGSRIFIVNPTETWITLLSSLGGVFNMFLGVGLFSALEILFLVFVKIPIAMRKSTEMENVSAPINK